MSMDFPSRSRSTTTGGAYKSSRRNSSSDDRRYRDRRDDDYDRGSSSSGRYHRNDRWHRYDDYDRKRYKTDLYNHGGKNYRSSIRRYRSRSRSAESSTSSSSYNSHSKRQHSRSHYSRSWSGERKYKNNVLLERKINDGKTRSRSKSTQRSALKIDVETTSSASTATNILASHTNNSNVYDDSCGTTLYLNYANDGDLPSSPPPPPPQPPAFFSQSNDIGSHCDYNDNVDEYADDGDGDDDDENYPQFDKAKIHQEMQERLVQHLAREGKVYPPPKPQASHPIFANDGSFLETFKRMQEQQQLIMHQQQRPLKHNSSQQQQHHHQQQQQQPQLTNDKRLQPQQHHQPMLFGKRRGGKILKTGIVEKQKTIEENTGDEVPKDSWAMYLQEVKKYKNVSCDADSKTRPLVK